MGRLENKHRGGLNNEKGSKYEEYYATYIIASLLQGFLEHNVLIKSQVEGAYIDDLIVETDNKCDYFQLKNVRNLKSIWAEIREDAVSQINLSSSKQEQFTITVVYSDSTFNIPLSDDIAQYTSLEWFPYFKSIYELITHYKPFKKALAELSVLENPTDDVLYGFAEYIIGKWCSIDRQKGLKISLLADQLITSRLNTILDSDREVSMECKEILDRIPGFTYIIRGKNIVWEIEHSKNNSTEWTKELDDRIVSKMPSSAKDIFKML